MLGWLGLGFAYVLWLAWLQAVTDAPARQWPTRFPWLLPVRGKWARRFLLVLSLFFSLASVLLIVKGLRA